MASRRRRRRSATTARLAPGDTSRGADNFYSSDRVTVQKVTFKNQYQMNVAGNLFVPNDLDRNAKHPAIVVGHPMGAVKEQSANLYATKLAEQGFVTCPSTCRSGARARGSRATRSRRTSTPRTSAPPWTTCGTRPFVDRERIGVLGICGSGSFVISAAKIDPRMKAVATVSMYDMGAANRNGLKQSQTLEQRKEIIAEAAEQRDVEFAGGETEYTGGTVHELTDGHSTRSSASSTTSTAPPAASTRPQARQPSSRRSRR